MHSTIGRRIVRVIVAGTVAASASIVLIAAPTSADAGHSLKGHSLKGHSLAGHSLSVRSSNGHSL